MQETSETKKTKMIYWIATVLFLLPLVFSAFAYLAQLPFVVMGFKILGYPIYLARILGVAKLLGAAAILTGRYPRMKEWAYAGFTFDLIGAAVSHIASGDMPGHALPSLVVLGLMLVSYFQWKKLSMDQTEIAPDHAGSINRAMGM